MFRQNEGSTMELREIQQYLKEHDLDGWLMADFHGRNEIAVAMIGLEGMLTRRSFYFIPVNGEPVALVNPIEASRFADVPGSVVLYAGYRGLEKELARILTDCRRVAMEYSPFNRLPYIGLVDAGTIELVRGLHVEIVSSADMVARFRARLSPEQVASHRQAAQYLLEAKTHAFGYITECLKRDTPVTEFDVCQFILSEFNKRHMVTDSGPNCSVGAHAGDPHYEPSQQHSAVIQRGQVVLLDMWAKLDSEHGAYADITWMGFAGPREAIPPRYTELFRVVRQARDAAVTALRQSLTSGSALGSQIDDACRRVVEDAGYGPQFFHRTGHSIATQVHGPGPNIDNLEAEDNRVLQSGHLFSIEPGVYFEDCGFRTEIDCLITDHGLEITTMPLQTEILALL
jgi:Xaa-Pro dipeptidase